LFILHLAYKRIIGSLAIALPDFVINVIYELQSCLITIVGFIIMHGKIILLLVTWSDYPR
jgi:hypothetical protein